MSTIYKWHERTITWHTDLTVRAKPERKCDEQLLLRISQILNEQPYSSVWTIADNLGETTIIVYK